MKIETVQYWLKKKGFDRMKGDYDCFWTFGGRVNDHHVSVKIMFNDKLQSKSEYNYIITVVGEHGHMQAGGITWKEIEKYCDAFEIPLNDTSKEID